MSTKKRILSLLLCLVILFGCIPTSFATDSTGTTDETMPTFYMKEDFEDKAGTAGYSSNGDDNDYLILKQTEEATGVVKKVFDIAETPITDTFVLEYKIKVNKVNSTLGNTEEYFQHYFNDAKNLGAIRLDRVPADGEWHHVIFIVTPGVKSGIFKVDTTTIASTLDFSKLESISKISFRLPNNTALANQEVFIDDLMVYSGDRLLSEYSGYTPQYTITFKDYDGTIISERKYAKDATIVVPANPERAADDEYTYTFKDWGKTVAATATADAVYTAAYTETEKEAPRYTVVFEDWDGTEISKAVYDRGAAITVPDDPQRKETAEYTFSFTGWTPEVSATAVESVTYTAQYAQTPKSGLTVFVNNDFESAAGKAGIVWTVQGVDSGNERYSDNGSGNDYALFVKGTQTNKKYEYTQNINNDGLMANFKIEFKLKMVAEPSRDNWDGEKFYARLWFNGAQANATQYFYAADTPASENWYQVVVNVTPGKAEGSMYIYDSEGKTVSSTTGISFTSIPSVTSATFAIASYCTGIQLYMDDFRVHNGTKLLDEYDPSEIPDVYEQDLYTDCVVVKDNKAAIAALGQTAVAMAVNSDAIYYNGALHEADKAVSYNGEAAFPLSALQAAFPALSSETLATTTIDGKPYLTLSALKTAMEALGKVVTYEERGFVVIDASAFTDTESTRLEVLHYLLYDRPEQSRIKADYAANANGSHPRVLIDQNDLTTLRSKYETDATIRAWANEIIATADKAMTEALPTWSLSSSNQIIAQSRMVYNRSKQYGLAYLLTGEKKYVDRLYQYYEAVAAFSSWNYEVSFLDTAELIAGFAIGYDWLYDAWTEEQREFIAETMYTKGIKPGYDTYYGLETETWWANTLVNWNAVCNGGMLMGAVALFDIGKYQNICADIVQISTRGIEKMLDQFYPSGAWSEGPMYWAYTMDYTQNMFSTLQAAFGTMYNLENAPALNLTLDYFLATDGPTGLNNFHDTQGDEHMDSESLTWLGRVYQSADAMSVRKSLIDQGVAEVTVSDVLYYDSSLLSSDVQRQLDYYLRNTEQVSLRETFDDFESAWISFHAGVATYNHSHLDTGTYVADLLGQRWAIDLGSDSYSVTDYDVSNHGTTSTGDLFRVYRKRPEGHNLYVINPETDEHYAGQATDTFVSVEEVVSKDRGVYSWIDLTEAYGRDVTSAKRGYMLADERTSIVIRDEISFKTGNNTFYWFNHINEDTTWEIVDNQTIILTQNGVSVYFQVETNLTDYTLSVVDAVPLESSPVIPDQATNAGIHKIQIYSANASGDIYVQVRFIGMDNAAADTPVEGTMTIAGWNASIPDGERAEKITPPVLSGISCRGTDVSSFSSSKMMYTISVAYDATEVPEVTATAAADGAAVAITPAATLDEYTVIKVYWKDHPESYRTYRVKFSRLAKLEDIDDWKRLQVVGHAASDEPEDNHPASNVSNNDISAESRWAAEGAGSWLCLDLGSVQEFSAIGLAWWKGDGRQYSFDIEISTDGVNFTKLLENQKSSGTTSGYEIFELSQSASARYVRYVGGGNTVNAWNSVTEFAVLTKETATVESYTLTVNYVYADGTAAAASVVRNLRAGDAYALESPKLAGYAADTQVVSGTMPEENVTITITYYPNLTPVIVTTTSGKSGLKLNTTDRFAYVQGYPDGTVKPTGNITRAETAMILFRLMDESTREKYYSTTSGFRDVDADAWYNICVATLNRAGVITDSDNGDFRPNEAITRAELAAMLAQFADKQSTANRFTDVSATHWAANAIAICAGLGWINGYPDGTFRPDKNVTRAELMAMVNRATGRTPESAAALPAGMKTWTDNADTTVWYYLDVQEATNSHT